jgi:hypothetical protein
MSSIETEWSTDSEDEGIYIYVSKYNKDNFLHLNDFFRSAQHMEKISFSFSCVPRVI